jgi:hypothetical protein
VRVKKDSDDHEHVALATEAKICKVTEAVISAVGGRI